jgi:hypothetical protein
VRTTPDGRGDREVVGEVLAVGLWELTHGTSVAHRRIRHATHKTLPGEIGDEDDRVLTVAVVPGESPPGFEPEPTIEGDRPLVRVTDLEFDEVDRLGEEDRERPGEEAASVAPTPVMGVDGTTGGSGPGRRAAGRGGKLAGGDGKGGGTLSATAGAGG